jgi:hypothetical protein
LKINFSRHPKRRAKLYNISESEITDILNSVNLRQGEQEILRDVAGFPEAMFEELKLLTNKKDVPYQSLVKIFLAERIEQELDTYSKA